MTAILEFVLANGFDLGLWFLTDVVALVVFAANTFTVWLPNHSDNKYLQWVLDFLNALSFNIAKNANRLHHTLEKASRDKSDYLDEAIDRNIDRRDDRRAGGRP